MEKKRYIKPNMMAYPVTPTEILAGSDFSSGGSGNPAGGRSKQSLLDVLDGNGEYTNTGFDINETTE